MIAIRTEGLTKDYPIGFWRTRRYRALDGLDLEVEAGESFGVLGPNGAGKTTTLKLLLQLVYPTSGRAEIFGRPVGDLAIKQRIGYLPENPYFYDHLTGEELLLYFAGLFGVSSAAARARVAKLLDEVGIQAERRLPLRRYSKGMLQRVGLAQDMLNDPEIVFLDEPMSGLDPIGRREVRELILRLRRQGRTVFFCSHILSDAERVCSRVAILAGGRLVSTGRLTDMTAFETRAWELVLADVGAELLERLRPMALNVTSLDHERVALELSLDRPPEHVVAEAVAAGASLVSLNPVRDTLEDFFMKQVAHARTGTGGQSRFH